MSEGSVDFKSVFYNFDDMCIGSNAFIYIFLVILLGFICCETSLVTVID